MLSLSVPNSKSSRRDWRRSAVFVFLPALVLLISGLFLLATASGAAAATDSPKKQFPQFRAYDFPRTQLDNPTVPWVVVNKQRPVTQQQFVPSDLVAPPSSQTLDNSRGIRLTPGSAQAVSELADAMSANTAAQLVLHSGFRSFAYQSDLFAAKVEQYGEEVALIRSAKAGFSEHQTGLAVDVSAFGYGCVIEECFHVMPPTSA
jgi:D-alanyl-D-alanine carboxypeptidase